MLKRNTLEQELINETLLVLDKQTQRRCRNDKKRHFQLVLFVLGLELESNIPDRR
jgi:hypothetical protein